MTRMNVHTPRTPQEKREASTARRHRSELNEPHQESYQLVSRSAIEAQLSAGGPKSYVKSACSRAATGRAMLSFSTPA